MTYEVRGNSMSGIIEHGDTVETVSNGVLNRNDLVIFKHGNDVSIKRLLGLPGDGIYTINLSFTTSKGKCVFVLWQNELEYVPVNNVQYHLWESWKLPFIIPDGKIFVVGTDQFSIDSRSLGYIDLYESFISKVVKVQTK